MKIIILGLTIVLMTLSGCKERTTVDSKVRIRTHEFLSNEFQNCEIIFRS